MEEERERRTAIRVLSMNLVYVDPEKTSSVVHSLGRTLELNLAGATVEVVDQLPVGTLLELELAIGETLITLRGQVKNVQPSESDLYRVGIQFIPPGTVRLA
ncbi:MAG: hypothetical protein JRI46_02360 [Deltaproteobacteria bacterium]|nr:hypothetical protein [Deltaproteobacteria bacterium]